MAFPKFSPNVRNVFVQGGQFRLAALPAGMMLRDVLPLFEKFKTGTGTSLLDQAPQLAVVIAESITQGGTETTAQEVMDACDFATMMNIFLEVIRTNGMTSQTGQDGAVGEAQGQSPLTGDGPLPTSSPSPDGPTDTSTMS